jgi:hypothetical protein
MTTHASTLDRRQWRQIGTITATALAVYLGLRWLPTGTNLSHMDFRVDPKEGKAIEFCDPSNPQFIPVVAARSPVAMTVALAAPAAEGRIAATVKLATTTGKPVVPEDLLVTHTRRLHLLIVDPTLRDYQHVHPEPTRTPGEWRFEFSPRLGGRYRFFGDFTPAATGRGLYASADATVVPGPGARIEGPEKFGPTVDRHGYRFALEVPGAGARAGQAFDLRFTVRKADGGRVPLEPVMGAFAHLVAFDPERSGFAHLHPTDVDLARPPDAVQPTLNFKLTIPRAGDYVVWAQVNLAGTEEFVPFALKVAE